MNEFIEVVLKHAQSGQSGIFFVLFVIIIWFFRRDAQEHKREYRETALQMFGVVNKNTEANTRLAESIKDLKDRIK